MLTGKGKILNMPTKTDKKTYNKCYIYVSADVAKDSQFPFKPGDELEIRINADKTLTVLLPKVPPGL
jgi:protein involved in polysaccharide export with SLBB domain